MSGAAERRSSGDAEAPVGLAAAGPTSPTRSSVPVVFAAGAAVLATLSSWLFPDAFGVHLLLPPGRHLVLWTRRAGIVGALGLSLLLLGVLLARRSSRGGLQARLAAHVAAPLVLMPLAYLGFFCARWLPAAVPPNLLFFVPVLLASLSVFRWLRRADAQGAGPPLTSRSVFAVGAGAALLYALTGWYFTVSVGEAGGDAGHYLAMTESLWKDHDLDLRNNIGELAERKPQLMHISRFSRGGHLYSWHPIGLPLLLAPFYPLGIAVRHVLLGLLSGLCLAGVTELCRLFGARRRWSLAVVLLFASSTYWGVYSTRYLPEVGGAALAAWGLVALLRQRERPWGSGWLCLACCAYLPWLHDRFLPVSGVIFAAYALAALSQPGSRRPALQRLGVLSLAYLLSLAGYAALRFAMFTGGLPVRATDFLLSNPLGIWHVIASDHGLLAVLPLFAALLAAAVWVVLCDRVNRRGALTILVLGAVVLVTSCSHRSWDGGASLPGRFLLVVAPLFIPCLARALERGGPLLRWWSVFLGLIPCLLFLLMLARLAQFRSILDPRGVASMEYDHLNGLMEFFAASGDTWLHPFALALLGGTGLLLFFERRWGRLAPLLPGWVALAAAFLGDPSYHPRMVQAGRTVNARRLAELGAGLESARIQAWGDRSPLALFTVSDLFSLVKAPALVTRGTAPAAGNDWAGRGYRWVPLAGAFAADAGWRACRLRGRVTGNAAAHWAIREGSRTLLEERLAPRPDGAIDVTVQLRCDGSGPVSLLVRFEGEDGTLRAPRISWSPFSPALLAAGGLAL